MLHLNGIIRNATSVYFDLQSCALLHPKAAVLGLTSEKIVGISACVTRASVWTELGKVRLCCVGEFAVTL